MVKTHHQPAWHSTKISVHFLEVRILEDDPSLNAGRGGGISKHMATGNDGEMMGKWRENHETSVFFEAEDLTTKISQRRTIVLLVYQEFDFGKGRKGWTF